MELEAQIGELLRKKNMKLVIAESCTGGLIGHRITNIPGSSDYYLGSITAYAYEAKERFLGVSKETLARYGAVSRETVLEMARGIRNSLAGAFPIDQLIGVSVSGIAGPDGATPDKPVGLIWIGMSTAQGDHAWKFQWLGNRVQNKEQSAEVALQLVVDYLQDNLTEESQ